VGDAPFGYVNSFKSHVNVGFFQGAGLKDPAGLLEGSGKRKRHVKIDAWPRDQHAVTIARLTELLVEAGFVEVERRDSAYFQPIVFGRRGET
jgi:hypothetical protein